MKIVYIYLLMAVTALAAATSCDKDDTPQSATGPIEARIMVCDGNGTRVGSDATDNAIRQLRVYAFKNGKKVGYAEADNLTNQSYIPIILSDGGDINFYVIANDKFGPKPTVGTSVVNNWHSLSKADLESLKFDLSGFDSWQEIDGDFVSPMSNCRYDEFGDEFTGKYENDYATAYPVKRPASGSLVIPVTVQHVLGRLRLMLNKDRDADNGLTITVTRAAVSHSPDVAHLYTVQGLNQSATNITYRFPTVTEEIISADSPVTLDPQHADGSYTTVARTYLAPNQHGTYDKTGGTFTTSEGIITETGKDKAYRLELTVKFDYGNNHTETKYTVYLPRVPRNTSIDVQGTFKGSTTINPTFDIMVNAWVEKNIDIPEFL